MSGFASLLLSVLVIPASQGPDKDWERLRGRAESQHEIIMMLIEEGKFEEAKREAKKLCELPFPVKEQRRLVEAVRIIGNALRHQKQPKMAHEVFDEALKAVTLNKDKAQLFREKAYTCRETGDKDCAMANFKKAVSLEPSQD